MKTSTKIIFALFLATAGFLVVIFGWQPTVAALRQIVYPIKFNDGLAGYWSFNGADVSGTTATDRSGNGLSGTLAGTPKRRSGVVGQALDFDGTDNTVTVAHNAALSPASISVEFWMMANREVAFQSPLAKTSTCSWNDGYGFYNRSSNSTFEWWVDQYSGTPPSGGGHVIATMPSVGQWHHVVGTYDGTTVILYIDGAVSGTPNVYSTEITYIDTDLVVGFAPCGAYWDGALDEVKIYNRALSATEVAEHYKSSVRVEGSKQNISENKSFDSGLVSLWSFNGPDVSGTTAYDRGPGGNNGTLAGTPRRSSGIVGQSLDFIDFSTPRYVQVTDNGNLDITDNLTISAWIREDSEVIGYATHLVNKWSGTDDANYVLYWFGTTSGADEGTIRWYANAGGVWKAISGNYTLPLGRWVHVALVYNSVTGGQLYIDGVATGALTGSGTLATNAVDLIIGGANTVGSDGFMDEVRIYNRALTAAEIFDQYKATAPIERSKQNISQNNKFTDGMTLNIPFNGVDVSGATAFDRSGSGLNGTITGAVVRPGVIGQGLKFDGVDDVVTVTTDTPIDHGTGDFSIEFWFKTDGLVNLEGVVYKGTGPFNLNGTGWDFRARGAGVNTLEFCVNGGSGTCPRIQKTGFTTWSQWHHIVVTVDRTNTLSTMYLDGSSAGTMAHAPTYTDSYDLLIGNSFQAFLNGFMDEFRLYNRVLTATEAAEHYRAGKRE